MVIELFAGAGRLPVHELTVVVVAFFGMVAALAKSIMPHLAATITAWGNLPRNRPPNGDTSPGDLPTLPGPERRDAD